MLQFIQFITSKSTHRATYRAPLSHLDPYHHHPDVPNGNRPYPENVELHPPFPVDPPLLPHVVDLPVPLPPTVEKFPVRPLVADPVHLHLVKDLVHLPRADPVHHPEEEYLDHPPEEDYLDHLLVVVWEADLVQDPDPPLDKFVVDHPRHVAVTLPLAVILLPVAATLLLDAGIHLFLDAAEVVPQLVRVQVREVCHNPVILDLDRVDFDKGSKVVAERLYVQDCNEICLCLRNTNCISTRTVYYNTNIAVYNTNPKLYITRSTFETDYYQTQTKR